MVIVAVGAAVSAGSGSGDKSVVGTDVRSAGKAAPAFDLEEVRAGRDRVSLDDFDGKALVINFWASWCAPCAKEMPAFQAVHRKVGDRIAFVGINNTDSRRKAVEQLARAAVTYPSGYDPNGGVAGDYKLLGMPTTVFVGPDGRIKGRHNGELSGPELERLLARFFPS